MAGVLETYDLAVGYAGRAVLTDVSLTLERGHILCLVGPNGAGKSTLVATVSGLLAPLAGTVRIMGEDPAALDATALARLRAVLAGAQRAPQLLSVTDVVSQGRYPHTGPLGTLTKADRAAIERSLQLTGIAELAEQDVSKLSDGQRQRVALARVICQETPLLILDEPLAHLDIRHQIDVLRLMRHLAHDEGVAVLAVLHELSAVASVADDVCLINDGTVVAQGPRAEVLTSRAVCALFDLEPGSFDPVTGAVDLGAGGAR